MTLFFFIFFGYLRVGVLVVISFIVVMVPAMNSVFEASDECILIANYALSLRRFQQHRVGLMA